MQNSSEGEIRTVQSYVGPSKKSLKLCLVNEPNIVPGDVDAAEKLRVISALSERSAKSCAFNRPPNAMAPVKKVNPV